MPTLFEGEHNNFVVHIANSIYSQFDVFLIHVDFELVICLENTPVGPAQHVLIIIV